MIVLRGRTATFGEVFFDEPATAAGVDVLRYLQRPMPLAAARCTPFRTVLIDLTRSVASLTRDMSHGARYEIRRAETRDGLDEAHWSPADPAIAEEMCAFYDLATRGIPVSRPRMRAYAASGSLDVSRIARAGEPLAWHAYYRTDRRARLLCSASAFRMSPSPEHRSRCSRANRLLHWRDMLRLRDAGIRWYDLGGWYGAGPDRQKRAIDLFKGSFGGSVVTEYDCVRGLTVRGEAALAVERLLAVAPSTVRAWLMRRVNGAR